MATERNIGKAEEMLAQTNQKNGTWGQKELIIWTANAVIFLLCRYIDGK